MHSWEHKLPAPDWKSLSILITSIFLLSITSIYSLNSCQIQNKKQGPWFIHIECPALVKIPMANRSNSSLSSSLWRCQKLISLKVWPPSSKSSLSKFHSIDQMNILLLQHHPQIKQKKKRNSVAKKQKKENIGEADEVCLVWQLTCLRDDRVSKKFWPFTNLSWPALATNFWPRFYKDHCKTINIRHCKYKNIKNQWTRRIKREDLTETLCFLGFVELVLDILMISSAYTGMEVKHQFNHKKNRVQNHSFGYLMPYPFSSQLEQLLHQSRG